MNTTLTDDLVNQLRGGPMQQLAQSLGLTPDVAMSAVSAALPLLIASLGGNARSPAGAQGLFSALDQDHRGLDPGNVLGTTLGGGGQGTQILSHIFGARQPVASQALGSIGGLGQDRAGTLLRVLAPIVMAYLARRLFTPRASDGATTPEASPQGLSSALQTETERLRGQPGQASELMARLDRDHDGDVDLDDLSASAPTPQTAEMRSPRPLL